MQYILFRRQLFFNRENIAMSESHTKLEELPFSFQGVEEKYGSLIDAEELCPGVYYASARLLERYTFLVAQYMVVTAMYWEIGRAHV